MYAIVKTGGKQYRVEQGQTLLVERLPEPEGATVNLEPLLYRSDEAVFDAAALAKVEVQATIVGHLRGKKLRVFKFKPKRGYRRRTGHRQELTRIEVTDISMGAAAKDSAAKTTAKPVAAKPADAKPADAKPAEAKPAAKASAKPAAAKRAAPAKPSPSNPPSPAAASRGGKEQEDPNGS